MKIKLINSAAPLLRKQGKEGGTTQFLLMIPGTYDSDPMERRVGTVLVKLAIRNEEAR
jgi:hypothetical protein